jgi:hypothetical protein
MYIISIKKKKKESASDMLRLDNFCCAFESQMMSDHTPFMEKGCDYTEQFGDMPVTVQIASTCIADVYFCLPSYPFTIRIL